MVLKMSGLTTADKIALHRMFPDIWVHSVASTELQNVLGWMVRSVVKDGRELSGEESS